MKRLAFSPSTILRCLNRVALSFLTSWILSVDFLTSTWSFLLNMVQCEPPAAARTGTTIDTTAPRRWSTSIAMPINWLTRYHPASDARRQRAWLNLYHVKSASNFAHTPPIRCTWRPSWEAARQRCARYLGGQWHHPSSNLLDRRDRGQVYNIRGN